jgi:hypothetical protein
MTSLDSTKFNPREVQYTAEVPSGNTAVVAIIKLRVIKHSLMTTPPPCGRYILPGKRGLCVSVNLKAMPAAVLTTGRATHARHISNKLPEK